MLFSKSAPMAGIEMLDGCMAAATISKTPDCAATPSMYTYSRASKMQGRALSSINARVCTVGWISHAWVRMLVPRSLSLMQAAESQRYLVRCKRSGTQAANYSYFGGGGGASKGWGPKQICQATLMSPTMSQVNTTVESSTG